MLFDVPAQMQKFIGDGAELNTNPRLICSLPKLFHQMRMF
jgi:hypothetical protein